MLVIRMQRTGRKGHAMFRLVVQDSRVTPTSGKVVAALGHYDPHTKTATIDKEKAVEYMKNGAQPSDRAALLLKQEGVKLPAWVVVDTKKTSKTKNAEKLRKNQPKDVKPAATEATEEPAEEPAAETPSETPEAEAPATEEAAPAEEAPVEAAAPEEPQADEEQKA